MNPAYWEQIVYTDSYDPLCTFEFYFEGDYRQDGDGDIVFVAISQTIYVFCESSSLDLDWSRVYHLQVLTSSILKGIQVQALWFIMSVMLVKATSGVGDAAMISAQGVVSKISFSFLKSAREKSQHLMDEGKSVHNFKSNSKKIRVGKISWRR